MACSRRRLLPLDRGGITLVGDGGDPLVVVRTRSGADGYVLYSSSTRAAGVEELLAHGGATPLDDETAETLRIEAGIPRFLVDMTDETIPLEANLDHAISHTKGCYVGQEIIVRIRDLAKGRVARRIVGLLPEGEAVPASAPPCSPMAGPSGVSRAPPGHPLSSARSRWPSSIAIAPQPGTVVAVNGATAIVTPLPFV